MLNVTSYCHKEQNILEVLYHEKNISPLSGNKYTVNAGKPPNQSASCVLIYKMGNCYLSLTSSVPYLYSEICMNI